MVILQDCTTVSISIRLCRIVYISVKVKTIDQWRWMDLEIFSNTTCYHTYTSIDHYRLLETLIKMVYPHKSYRGHYGIKSIIIVTSVSVVLRGKSKLIFVFVLSIMYVCGKMCLIGLFHGRHFYLLLHEKHFILSNVKLNERQTCASPQLRSWYKSKPGISSWKII